MKKFCYASLMLLLLAPSAVVAMEGGGATNPLAASSMTVARDGQDASLAAYETGLALMGNEEGIGAADSHNPIDMTKSTRFMGLQRDQYATPQDLEELTKKFESYVTREAFGHYKEMVDKILQALPTAIAHPTREEVTKQIADAVKSHPTHGDLRQGTELLLADLEKTYVKLAQHTEQQGEIEKLKMMFAKIQEINSWYGLHQKQDVARQQEIAALKQLINDNRTEYRTQLAALVRQQNATDGVVATLQSNAFDLELDRSVTDDESIKRRLAALETLVAQLQQPEAQVHAGQRASVIGDGLLFPPLPTIDTRKIALGTGVVGLGLVVLYLKKK